MNPDEPNTPPDTERDDNEDSEPASLVCPTCDGEGETQIGYGHPNDPATEYRTCRECGGEGRLVEGQIYCLAGDPREEPDYWEDM